MKNCENRSSAPYSGALSLEIGKLASLAFADDEGLFDVDDDEHSK